jgi:hypothetical protein
MKNQSPKNEEVSRKLLQRARRAMLLLALLILSLRGTSQNQTFPYFYYEDDVKNYSVETVPYFFWSWQGESVAAGTIFASPSWATPTRPHFQHLDYRGYCIFGCSKQYTDNSGIGVVEERVADIAATMYINGEDIYNVYYIVCLSRVRGQDRIKVLCVDDFGNILDERIYYDNFSQRNLYPMHSVIRWDNTDKKLYICGYSTPDGTSELAATAIGPDYTTDKKAFIIRLDIGPRPGTAGHMAFVNSMMYNWNWNSVWPVTPPSLDYDIAQRIRVVNQTGDIFITGSVNGFNPSGSPLNFRSATMNLVVDAATLTPIVNGDNPFMATCRAGTGIVKGDDIIPCEEFHDWGADLVQLDNQYYIVGSSALCDDGHTKLPNSSEGDMHTRVMHKFYVQHLNNGNDFVPQITRSAGGWWQWAMQALPSTAGGQSFTLATLQANNSFPNNTCWPNPPPTVNNVNVALLDIDVSSPTPTNTKRCTYICNTGTVHILNANSYWTLGGSLSLIDYPPTMADRKPGDANADYYINAPKDGYGYLGHKYVNPAPNLELTDSNCGWYAHCTEDLEDENVMWSNTVVAYGSLDLDEIVSTTDMDNFFGYNAAPCMHPDSSLGFKQGMTSILPAGNVKQEFLVYPNPASDHINILMSPHTSRDAMVKVVLLNLLGQKVAELFDGNINELRGRDVQLPQLASGTYMIHVFTNGKLVGRQKLLIN